jgi:hypothetical protein
LEEKMIMQAKALGRSSFRGLEGLKILLDPFLIKYPVLSGNTIAFVTAGDISEILKHMEELFADEISAYYYMNLCNDSNIRVSELPKHHYHSESFQAPNKPPKQSLLLLLEQDREKPLIKEWLCKWRDDLEKLQSAVLDNIKVMLEHRT